MCARKIKRRSRGGGSPSPARRTHRRRLLVAIATEGRGRGSREARGGEAQLVGVVAGAGEVRSYDRVVDRGGRAVVEDADEDSGHQSLRRGRHRVPGVLDWRRGEELVAGWFSRDESTRGRAAVVSPSPALWCSLGAATGWGGGLGLEGGGEVPSGCRGGLYRGSRVWRHGRP